MLINNHFYSSWFPFLLMIPFLCAAVFIILKRHTLFKSVEQFVYLISLGLGFLFLIIFLLIDSTTGQVWIITRGMDGSIVKDEKRLMWYSSYHLSNGTKVQLHSTEYLLVNDTDVPLTVIPVVYISRNFIGSIEEYRKNKDKYSKNKKAQNFVNYINERVFKGLRITKPFSTSEHSYLKYFGYKEEAPKENESVSSTESNKVSSWAWVLY